MAKEDIPGAFAVTDGLPQFVRDIQASIKHTQRNPVQVLIQTEKGQKVVFSGLKLSEVKEALNARDATALVLGRYGLRRVLLFGPTVSDKLREKYEKDKAAGNIDYFTSIDDQKEWTKKWIISNVPLTKKAKELREKILTTAGVSFAFDSKKNVTDENIKGAFDTGLPGLEKARTVAFLIKKSTAPETITESEQKQEESKQQEKLRNFREQGYLVAKMQELAAHNASLSYEYKNYAYLRSQPLNGPLTSQLQGISRSKLAPLLNLKNKQWSALTPMFRLFKIDNKNRKKVPEELKLQGNYYSIENKSLESIGRSGRLGLKSFTWTYDGKYLSTADKMIRGDLTLYGDSLTVFDEKIHDDLLVPLSGEWYALVGWAPPPNDAGGLFSQEEITALKNSLITLWIAFKIPQFTFKQDGTFELNLTFRSAIQQALNNVDIFGPTNAKEEMLNVSTAFRNKVLGTFTKLLKGRYNALEAKKYGAHKSAAMSVGVGAVGRGGSAAKIKAIDTKMLNVFKSETLLKAGIQPKNLAKAQNLIDTFMNREEVAGNLDYAHIFSERMHVLLEKKRSNKVFRRILEDIEEKKRKFYVTLTASEFDQFYKDFGPLTDTSTITPEEYEAMKKKNPPPPSNAPKKPTGASVVDKKVDVKTSLKDINPDEISVAFVYFGDIIESIFSTTKYQVPDKEKINFILSTLAYRDYFTQGNRGFKSVMTQVPIVDVPISVNYFTKWFHDEYIAKVSEKVTLDEFLNKALKTLLLPAMGPDNFRASFKNFAMAPHQFSWTSDRKGKPPRGLINFADLKDLIYQGSMSTRPTSYIVYSSWVYAKDEKAESSKGNIHSSTIDNIVLHLAKDQGLLKDVSFSRLNDPHWEGQKIRNDKITSNFERVRIPYTVEVKMIGNNLFFPGTAFQVYPTIPGSRSRDIANQLGLGGEYLAQSITNRIEPETGFTTEFTGKNFYMAGTEKKGKSSSAATPSTLGKTSPKEKPKSG